MLDWGSAQAFKGLSKRVLEAASDVARSEAL